MSALVTRFRTAQPRAADSLRQSADAFHRMGRDFDAQMCRTMADEARQMGPQIGDAHYRHWAGQMAERVIAKQGELK